MNRRLATTSHFEIPPDGGRIPHFFHFHGEIIMRVYKLFRQRKDGSLGPLFINARQRIAIGEWLPAEDRPTKGFAHRPGWHCGEVPAAPHLSESGRVWAECTIDGPWYRFQRPKNQGGEWIICNGRLRVERVLSDDQVAELRGEK